MKPQNLVTGLPVRASGGGHMSAAPPLATIPVGVVVERSKGASAMGRLSLARRSAVLTGVPDTPPWTKLSDDGERATFYAGAAEIELHRTETANYRDNLATGAPLLWVVLRRTESEPPYTVFAVSRPIRRKARR